jgi:hypothetical protein
MLATVSTPNRAAPILHAARGFPNFSVVLVIALFLG